MGKFHQTSVLESRGENWHLQGLRAREEGKLKVQLAEANSKFMRLETLLHSTEAELSAVKADLVNLRRSKEDIATSVNNNENNAVGTNRMLRKMLNKIFKQLKTTFTKPTGDVDSEQPLDETRAYSGQEVVDILAQHFRDVAQYVNAENEKAISDVNQSQQ